MKEDSLPSRVLPQVDATALARRRIRGSLWMIVAGLLFACMGVFVKLGLKYFSGAELVFYRSLFGVAVIFLVTRKMGLSIISHHWKIHVSRSLAGFSGMMLFFYTISVLPLSTATTLNYTSPLFLAILTVVVLKERPGPLLVIALAIGFAGIVMLLRPTFSENQLGAGLLGLVSGLMAAVAYLTTRHLGSLGEPAWRVVFYFTLVSSIGGAVWTTIDGFHEVGGQGFLLLLGMGVCGTLGQLAMTRAYREGHALTVGSFAYSTVVFTSLLSMLFWREMLSVGSWLAIVLIIASGVLAARSANRH